MKRIYHVRCIYNVPILADTAQGALAFFIELAAALKLAREFIAKMEVVNVHVRN